MLHQRGGETKAGDRAAPVTQGPRVPGACCRAQTLSILLPLIYSLSPWPSRPCELGWAELFPGLPGENDHEELDAGEAAHHARTGLTANGAGTAQPATRRPDKRALGKLLHRVSTSGPFGLDQV